MYLIGKLGAQNVKGVYSIGKIDNGVLTGIFGKSEVVVAKSQSQVFTVQARGPLSKSSS